LPLDNQHLGDRTAVLPIGWIDVLDLSDLGIPRRAEGLQGSDAKESRNDARLGVFICVRCFHPEAATALASTE
jgi:hypothetical protein